jgi:hypothetical protein
MRTARRGLKLDASKERALASAWLKIFRVITRRLWSAIPEREMNGAFIWGSSTVLKNDTQSLDEPSQATGSSGLHAAFGACA